MPFGLFVVAYLFLAGAGAGSFFFAACGAVCDALRRTARTERNLEILSGGFLASPFLLCLASICLLFDLGSPQRALLAFCDPFGSVLSFGACCLGLLTVVSIAVAALGIAEKFPVLFMRTGCALGIVLAPPCYGVHGRFAVRSGGGGLLEHPSPRRAFRLLVLVHGVCLLHAGSRPLAAACAFGHVLDGSLGSRLAYRGRHRARLLYDRQVPLFRGCPGIGPVSAMWRAGPRFLGRGCFVWTSHPRGSVFDSASGGLVAARSHRRLVVRAHRGICPSVRDRFGGLLYGHSCSHLMKRKKKQTMTNHPSSIQITIDQDNGIPIWLQLRNRLIYLISSGQYVKGDKLPTVREMAVKLGINYNTVSKVYQDIERDGYIKSQRGKGTFVHDGYLENPESASDEVDSLVDEFIFQCREMGVPRSDILSRVESRLSLI
ncbi:MAG: GntR family transcriptional regulator [Senegalimassilia sp.]|nr:GntR family transcriptional regulator [Senegalimassilia sp.]MDR4053822.1 GntR family transcriptional regulator [Senegalimassilia sp.]